MTGLFTRRHNLNGTVLDDFHLATEAETFSNRISTELGSILESRRAELALDQPNAATAATATRAAGRRDFNSGGLRRIQKSGPARDGGGFV